MTNKQIEDIYNQVVDELNDLVANGTLASVIEDFTIRTALNNPNIGKYPCAVLYPPALSSAFHTNAENIRSYDFEFDVIFRQEDETPQSLNVKREEIVNHFDARVTLDGNAGAGLMPTSSEVEDFNYQNQDFVVFRVKFTAKALYGFTFTNQ